MKDEISIGRIANLTKEKIACQNYLNQKAEKNNIKIMKFVATFFISIGITAGVVYAGVITYQKVWKLPEKYDTLEQMIEENRNTSTEITKEDINNIIEKQEAEKKAKSVMDKFGFAKKDIYSIELKKNYIESSDLIYLVKTEKQAEKGIDIWIDAKTGENLGIINNDLKYENINTDKIDEETAKIYAKELYSKFTTNQEFKLKYVQETPHYFENNSTNEWTATFCKQYDGIFYNYEKIVATFCVKDSKIYVDQIINMNLNMNFENNPIVITEEEAIEIAKESNSKITSNEIESIESNLDIKDMNEFIYLQEQSKGEDDGNTKETVEDENGVQTYRTYSLYKSDKIVRKVWRITINYVQGEIDLNNLNKYSSRDFYVDSTTGEIIGGRWSLPERVNE